MISLWIALSMLAIGVAAALAFPFAKQYKQNLKVIIAIMLFVPGFSLLWYHHFGASKKLVQRQQIQQQIAHARQEMEQYGSPKQIIAKLQQHLASNPKDDKGWYLLGKIYFDTGQHQTSLDCFSRAYQLNPNDNDYKVALSQALFFTHNKRLPKQAIKLVTDVLAEQPENADALNLLAVNDYVAGHYQQAIKRWKLLLPTYSADSTDGKALRMMIAKAQKLAQ